MTERMILADSLLAMPEMEPESIASTCTDPPYGLKFMGKTWDHGVPGEPYWREVLRVLKPGGYLVAFGGTRTHHRLMVAIEDAGFEIRDTLMWLHGQGFPKGKGQLKPAWEPIVLARKTAPSPWLNVDECRVATDWATDPTRRGWQGGNSAAEWDGGSVALAPSSRPGHQRVSQPHGDGRWPANVVLSHEDGCREVETKRVKGDPRGECNGSRPGGFANVGAYSGDGTPNARVYGTETVAAWECAPECAVRLLDEQSGERKSGGIVAGRPAGKNFAQSVVRTHVYDRPADTGGASRFFYCAKASPKERGVYNDWPTVKPLALMRWLVRLVTPAGGVVLDPFCGSGSTLLAARDEGFDVIGIDNDPHAFDIARKRLGHEEASVLIVGDRVRILAVKRQPREAGRE